MSDCDDENSVHSQEYYEGLQSEAIRRETSPPPFNVVAAPNLAHPRPIKIPAEHYFMTRSSIDLEKGHSTSTEPLHVESRALRWFRAFLYLLVGFTLGFAVSEFCKKDSTRIPRSFHGKERIHKHSEKIVSH
jgi:hypothetical protein